METYTILAVDDTPDNIAMLKLVLGEAYRIRAATSGTKALSICHEAQQPDLVLLDIMMPGMDGYAICAKLKSDPTTAHIPIIFLTAMDEEQDEAKGLALGAVDYIAKPISPTIVLQRVRTHLELQAARKAIEELSRKYSAYLSPELVEGIRTGNIDGGVSTRRKMLTVMFSDIEGFSKISESLSPEDMTFALNCYFESMARIVAKYRGTLDKYIGDSVMVFFGDPESRGLREDATACISMALEMQHEIPLVELAWANRGIHQPLHIRVGIASGFCAVGNFGSASQLTYTIMGTTVNLASRLESNGLLDSIVVSEATWDLVRDKFVGTALKPMQVKGLAQPVAAYEVKEIPSGKAMAGSSGK